MLTINKKNSILLAVLALFAGAFSLALSGEAEAKPKITIVSAGQNQLANKGVLKVRVRSDRRGKLKVRGFSSTFDGRAVMKPLTKVARPRFKRKGQQRTIKLVLTAAAKKQVKTCQDREIQVRAGSVKSRTKAMVRQTADCKPPTVNLTRAADCNFIAAQDSAICMSPFPDNYYTQADERTETGRRINFTEAAMPVNSSEAGIDPAPYKESDGFSQGQTISVRVPGLDTPEALAATNPVGLSAPGKYLDKSAPVAVINAQTRERHPIWVELDSNAGAPGSTNLLIRPMTNFAAGSRYIVVLRNLKDSSGKVLTAPAGFRFYRDFLPSRSSRINGRRSFYEDIFRRLRNSGVTRSDLYLAWDFTTASDENNTRRALSMRDQAFSMLGDSNMEDRKADGSAPAFEVNSVDENPNGQIARRVRGTYEVPCFLSHPTSSNPCQSGATMKFDPDGVPVPNGTYKAKFDCVIPNTIVNPASLDPSDLPASALNGRALVYGHGLMGSIAGEIQAEAQRLMAARGFTICGTDEIGMATEDVVTVSSALIDLSGFPKIADRLQQGLLNEMYLARLMIHPQGLVSKAAFRFDPAEVDPVPVPGGDPDAIVAEGSGLEPTIVTGRDVRAWYRGNSQGGIMGGALMALAPDFDRGALGVAAMNYSVLLTRSTAWKTYGAFFNPSYTNEVERPLAISLAQMLWDRGEPNGYAGRMTSNPLPATPPHQVLLDTAFGDHLVTNWQTNALARTVGAKLIAPALASDRFPGVDFTWGVEPIAAYPYEGSALAYWDSGPVRPGGSPGSTVGTDPPPITNTAPLGGEDPHEHPRISGAAIEMIDGFLREGGAVSNTCLPGPCEGGGWTTP